MTDWNDLKDYVGSKDSNKDSFIETCYNTAVVLVDDALETAWREVPETVLSMLYLEVGSELFKRKDAPSGTSMYAQFDGGSVPLRGPRDPLSQVRPIINRYVVAF